MENQLIVCPSPHLRHEDTTRGIMLDVLIALVPAALAGIVLFGPRAAAVLAVSILSALLSEWICCKVRKRPNTLGDLSAAVTGLLLGLNLPVGLPLWMAAIGSAVAIVIVYTFAMSYLGYWLIDKVIPMRVSAQSERVGLDFSQHEEHYGLSHIGEREIAEYEDYLRQKE